MKWPSQAKTEGDSISVSFVTKVWGSKGRLGSFNRLFRLADGSLESLHLLAGAIGPRRPGIRRFIKHRQNQRTDSVLP